MTNELETLNNNTFELIVDEDNDGERLDKFLAQALPQYSREYLKKLIGENLITLNSSKKIKPALTLEAGQSLILKIPEPVPLELLAEDLPLEIVFEDSELFVINKPNGMLTHPTPREKTGTLVNALLFKSPQSLSGINGVERPGIVHRLDRETSGLMVVAKTDHAHRSLQQQLQERSLKRTYRALVQGIPQEEAGIVNLPIGRNPRNRDKMAVVQEGGRHAVTHWQRAETYHKKYALMQLNLETGRTHQIRVHLSYIGFPVVGDPLYGKGLEHQIKAFTQGQVLQSYQIGFIHPTTHEKMQFEIPMDEKFQTAMNYVMSL